MHVRIRCCTFVSNCFPWPPGCRRSGDSSSKRRALDSVKQRSPTSLEAILALVTQVWGRARCLELYFEFEEACLKGLCSSGATTRVIHKLSARRIAMNRIVVDLQRIIRATLLVHICQHADVQHIHRSGHTDNQMNCTVYNFYFSVDFLLCGYVHALRNLRCLSECVSAQVGCGTRRAPSTTAHLFACNACTKSCVFVLSAHIVLRCIVR